MGRSRVLSFMSTFGGPQKSSSGTSSPVQQSPKPNYTVNPAYGSANVTSPISETPTSRAPVRQRADSRPLSISAGYVGPIMDTQDTVPELLPIFNCLNSHSNKLYQEGYFLKLNDLDSQGRPFHDRSWTECFAQLVGTVLSIWDAAALDNAASDGEVPATFINLGDASIKMIETLETRSRDAQPLQNVLSISTAGKNRYLFHFSNVHAMTQWTAGIRLAMFEHSSLQETYTGALIGGKGRALNNIRTIMTYSKFQTSDWVRVRFGAGTPWRRCWCVISPPDEKEVAKAQKSLKKKSSYDRAQVLLKGDVKFYEVKKITKKTQPIATITNAYAAYAIYPQSKPLIEQSTLIKIEGNVTIHTNPQTKLESFIFVMPETHEAVTGFEMLLRFIFPIWDVFALYGRPQRLIPDTWNPKSLMFAMPKHDRWGYLDILDVNTLVTRPGSANWSEAEWKLQLKKLTAERIEKLARDPSRTSSRPSSQYGRAHRNSLPSRTAALKFADDPAAESRTSLQQDRDLQNSTRSNTGSAPPAVAPFPPPHGKSKGHGRSISESVPNSPHRRAQDDYHPSRLSREATRPTYLSDDEGLPPVPPTHILPPALTHGVSEEPRTYHNSSEDEHAFHDTPESQRQVGEQRIDPASMVDKPPSPVQPVAPPPAFSHQPGAKPQTRPYQSPELRRANSRMSSATLSQLAAAAGKQALPDNTIGGEQRTNDAYNRPHPITNNSNQSGVLVNDPASSSGYNSDAESSQRSTNLKAPVNQTGRSASPLRQVAAMTPEDKLASSYFTDNPFGAQYNQDHSPSRRSYREQPRNKSTERPSSLGKINRKPVPPSPSKVPPEFITAPETSPTEAARNRDVEDAIVNRMNTVHSKASTLSRTYSGEGSNYDSDTPEHESFPFSNHGREIPRSVDQPRAGRMKVVGSDLALEQNENWEIHSQSTTPSNDIPNVDFGPTHLYQPELQTSTKSTGHLTTGNSSRNGHSPTRRADNYNGSPSRSPLPTPDGSHLRSGSNEDRSYAWRPGMASPGQSIAPEQFVHQRAAANRVPVYAHTRQLSTPDVRSYSRQTSRTPPLVATNTENWSTYPDQHNSHHDPPPDYSRHLSAREQEHVAKVTGSPLLNVERKPVQATTQHGGLVGAIEAREQEKKVIKEGYGGYMVQQAIAQRQQQEYPQPSPQYYVPGQFPITPQFGSASWDQSQQQQQQQNPYDNQNPGYGASQGYGGPTYGRQTPQDYYRQSHQNSYSQDPNQNQGRSSGQLNPNYNAHRG